MIVTALPALPRYENFNEADVPIPLPIHFIVKPLQFHVSFFK